MEARIRIGLNLNISLSPLGRTSEDGSIVACSQLVVGFIIATLTDGFVIFNSVDILRPRTDIIKFVRLATPGLIRVKNSQGSAGINLYSVTDPTTSLDITLVNHDTILPN